jgi:outer membrane protein assembly factor BamB
MFAFAAPIRYENAIGYDGKPLYGLHYEGVIATFTKPDGSKDTFMPLSGSYKAINTWPGQTEETGGLWFPYYPSQVGDWTVQFSYPGQSWTFDNWTVAFLPSTSQLVSFTVQTEAVRIGLPPVDLPTGYWEMPISPNNREWYTLGGPWLGNTHRGNFNPYTTAPATAHILWKQEGKSAVGIAGGDMGTFSYTGGTPFSVSNIWNGRIYYSYRPDPDSGNFVVCADQYTGEIIWERPFGSFSPYGGGGLTMYMTFPSPTATTEFTGSPRAEMWQYASTAWTRYDPATGSVAQTILPAAGQSILTSPNFDSTYNYAYFTQTGRPMPYRRQYFNLIGWSRAAARTNWNAGIMFNVSVMQPDGTDPGFRPRMHVRDDIGLVIVTAVGNPNLYAFDMITGEALWVESMGFSKMYDETWTPDGKYIAMNTADMLYTCFNVSKTGLDLLWVSEVQPGMYPWHAFQRGADCASFAYGNMYTGGYDGQVECWDPETGEIKWTSLTESTTELPSGAYPTDEPLIADGKGYLYVDEHSPTQPLFRGSKLFCFDVFTGEPIWNITGYFLPTAIAGGYLYAGDSRYTGSTYCFGKGQTETTTSVQTDVTERGSTVLIKGTVMDMSPAQPGTPAISDEGMTEWMNYLHMQDAELINNPPTPKGVEVTLTAIDPNGNLQNIGIATSDFAGTFGMSWLPPVPGTYLIIAEFEGSESYWSSRATTYLQVTDRLSSSMPTNLGLTPESTGALSLISNEIAFIAAIAVAVVIGTAATWALKKRK